MREKLLEELCIVHASVAKRNTGYAIMLCNDDGNTVWGGGGGYRIKRAKNVEDPEDPHFWASRIWIR